MNYFSPIKAIAFDFGNTLFSTSCFGKFNNTLKNIFMDKVTKLLSLPYPKAELIFQEYTGNLEKRRQYNSSQLPDKEESALLCLKKAFCTYEMNPSLNVLVEILDDFHSCEAQNLEPLPGSVMIIKELYSKKYKLGILSNNPWSKTITFPLEKHGISKLFSTIIASCDVGYRKPCEDIFQLLLDQWSNIDPGKIMYIGDSYKHDIVVPKKLGLKTCLVNIENNNLNNQKKYHDKADLYITDYQQLLDIL